MENISKQDKTGIYATLPVYFLYEYPKKLLHYANVLRKAKWDGIDVPKKASWDDVFTAIFEKAPNAAVDAEFESGAHAQLDIKGRQVVDLGAYTGDTAIYYAKRGASHVYAFESRKSVVDTANGVIKRYHLEKKITMFHRFVNASNFNTLMRQLRIRHGALKIDIEGGEYQVIKGAASGTLHRFDVIHIEYHYGYVDLVERLKEEGFEVSHTKPRYDFKGISRKPMLLGDVYAHTGRNNYGRRNV